jgi:hypothetical protein
MNVVFDDVTPGIALGTKDATNLKREIDTYVTAAVNLRPPVNVRWRDFKDSDGRKRNVEFVVVSTHPDIHVNVTRFERR